MQLSNEKKQLMQNLLNDKGIIAALAIDQRGALKKILSKYNIDGIQFSLYLD